MSASRVSSQSAYLIHTRAYRETSLIVEAFTQDYGRVSLIAKGVRKKNSSIAAQLQPFKALSLSWQGRSALQTLTVADAIDEAPRLQGKAVFCGFYLNELLTFLLAKYDPHPALYLYYKTTLENLNLPDCQEMALRYFEMKLLEEIGYGLSLECERNGRRIIADSLYLYHPEEGALLVDSQQEEAVHGQTLIDLNNHSLASPRGLLEAKKLMRTMIKCRLGGRNLKSRELFKGTSLKS